MNLDNPNALSHNGDKNFSIVAIGISTGGPKALAEVIPKLTPDLPVGIVIAQHIPPVFTKSLAKRLDSISKIKVKEATNGEYIKPGHAYICPGDMNIAVEKENIITLYPKEKFNYIYVPSVNLLMKSVGKTYGKRALCVIMTGMGSDGLEGIKTARENGSYIITQSKSTSTIFGMPKAIIEHGLHHEIVDLGNIATRINQLCSR